MQRFVLPPRLGISTPVIAGLVVLLGAMAIGAVVGLRPALAPAILASPLIIAAAWVAFRAPGITFAAYVAIPFYKPGLAPHVPLDLSVILALVLTVQAALAFLPGARDAAGRILADPVRRRAVLIWFTLTVLFVLGALYAADSAFALEVALNWIVLAALPFLAAFQLARDPRFVRQFLWSLFALGVAVTVVGLWLLPQVGAWPTDRLIVFGAHTIRVGQAALLVPIVGFAFVLPTTKPPARLVYLALIPPALLVAASSGSRGPLIMAAITIAILAIRRLVGRLRAHQHRPLTIAPIRIAVIGTIGILLISLLQPSAVVNLLPESATDRFGTVSEIIAGLAGQDLEQTAPDESTADRLIAYAAAVDLFNSNPILGRGTASFTTWAATSELSDWAPDAAYPHNIILQFAAENGIIGLVVLVVVLFSAFRGLLPRSHNPTWNAILVLLVFFLLNSLVSSGIIDNKPLWGLVALGIAASSTEGTRFRSGSNSAGRFVVVSPR
jgi:O-antigen ligase